MDNQILKNTGGLHTRHTPFRASRGHPQRLFKQATCPRTRGVAAAVNQQQQQRIIATAASSMNSRKARRKEDLHDPAQIGATGTAEFRVPDYGGSVSLASYMMLPVEQYFVLDPKQISWLEGNRFLLTVPRLEFFNIWLEPEVEISVVSQLKPPRVVLQAENCRIRGSDLIEQMKLDQKFCLRFVTELSWSSSPMFGASSDSSDNSDLDDSPGAPAGRGQISGRLQLDVWSEVIPPFNLMPREVLQGSCNVVMQGLVGSLLPLFVRKLGEDYQKWATDPLYRESRASRSKPLTSP